VVFLVWLAEAGCLLAWIMSDAHKTISSRCSKVGCVISGVAFPDEEIISNMVMCRLQVVIETWRRISACFYFVSFASAIAVNSDLLKMLLRFVNYELDFLWSQIWWSDHRVRSRISQSGYYFLRVWSHESEASHSRRPSLWLSEKLYNCIVRHEVIKLKVEVTCG